jgi:hypothetical protein
MSRTHTSRAIAVLAAVLASAAAAHGARTPREWTMAEQATLR